MRLCLYFMYKVFVFSTIRDYPIPFNLITIMIFDSEHKLRSQLSSFFHTNPTFSLHSPTLSAACRSHTTSVCCIPDMKDKISHPHKTTHTWHRIQGVYKRMVRFKKLTRNLFLILHGHNVHRQQRQLSKFLIRYQQFASHALCRAAGPVSKMASQQEKAFCVLRFEVSRSVITVQREFRAPCMVRLF